MWKGHRLALQGSRVWTDPVVGIGGGAGGRGEKCIIIIIPQMDIDEVGLVST